jgi:hypothetical protein
MPLPAGKAMSASHSALAGLPAEFEHHQTDTKLDPAAERD